MKQWLIPTILVLAVGGMGLGVGWSVNEWQDSSEATPAETSAETGPSQAELDAQRCEAALKAMSNLPPIPQAAPRTEPTGALQFREIKDAIDRYCH